MIHANAKVLLVEDDEQLRNLLAHALKTWGYLVIQARSAEEGLTLFRDHQADFTLLLSDVVMPGLHGDELVKRLRHEKPGLRYILMSGNLPEVVITQVPFEPGKTFLQKPFKLQQLLEVMRLLRSDLTADSTATTSGVAHWQG